MERWMSIELLNATHAFPCSVVIKVIGKSSDCFLDNVVAVVRQATTDEPPFTFRTTPNGKHMAITLEPTLQSAEEVLQIYEVLKDLEGVVMTL